MSNENDQIIFFLLQVQGPGTVSQVSRGPSRAVALPPTEDRVTKTTTTMQMPPTLFPSTLTATNVLSPPTLEATSAASTHTAARLVGTTA